MSAVKNVVLLWLSLRLAQAFSWVNSVLCKREGWGLHKTTEKRSARRPQSNWIFNKRLELFPDRERWLSFLRLNLLTGSANVIDLEFSDLEFEMKVGRIMIAWADGDHFGHRRFKFNKRGAMIIREKFEIHLVQFSCMLSETPFAINSNQVLRPQYNSFIVILTFIWDIIWCNSRLKTWIRRSIFAFHYYVFLSSAFMRMRKDITFYQTVYAIFCLTLSLFYKWLYILASFFEKFTSFQFSSYLNFSNRCNKL